MISIAFSLVFSTFLVAVFSNIISPMIVPNVGIEQDAVLSSINKAA